MSGKLLLCGFRSNSPMPCEQLASSSFHREKKRARIEAGEGGKETTKNQSRDWSRATDDFDSAFPSFQFFTHVAIAYASNCLASPSAALVDPEAAAAPSVAISAASLAPTGLPASSAGN